MTRGIQEQTPISTGSAEPLQTIAFSAFGVYYIFMGITYFSYFRFESFSYEMDQRSWIMIALGREESLKMLIFIVLGIGLMLGPTGRKRLLRKFREYGRRAALENGESPISDSRH